MKSFVSIMLLLCALSGVSLLTGCGSGGLAGQGTQLETFEGGWDGWVADNTRPDASPTAALSAQESNSPTSSISLFMNAIPTDDGVLWIEKQLQVPASTAVRVTVHFWLWSKDKLDASRWSAVAYIGRDRPTAENHFTILGDTDQVAGWKEYTYSTIINTDFFGTAYVALGISAVSAHARTYYVDDVLVSYFE